MNENSILKTIRHICTLNAFSFKNQLTKQKDRNLKNHQNLHTSVVVSSVRLTDCFLFADF